MNITTVDIVSDDFDMIEAALVLVASNWNVKGEATYAHFRINGDAIEFARSTTTQLPEWKDLPCPVNNAEVAPLLRAWLRMVTYPTSPDTDGTAKRAWRIECGDRSGLWNIAFRLSPAWTVYGK